MRGCSTNGTRVGSNVCVAGACSEGRLFGVCLALHATAAGSEPRHQEHCTQGHAQRHQQEPTARVPRRKVLDHKDALARSISWSYGDSPAQQRRESARTTWARFSGVTSMYNEQEVKVQTRGPDRGNPTSRRPGLCRGTPRLSGRDANAWRPARDGLKEVVDACRSRTKVKRRKACSTDKPSRSGARPISV